VPGLEYRFWGKAIGVLISEHSHERIRLFLKRLIEKDIHAFITLFVGVGW
jgi:hypothetical protein